MSPQLTPRAVADKARGVVATVRPGTAEGRRSLPIRSPEADVRRLSEEPAGLAKILHGIPVAEATLSLGPEAGDRGRTATVWLRLEDAPRGYAMFKEPGGRMRPRRLRPVTDPDA
jgi:hypothetical protein